MSSLSHCGFNHVELVSRFGARNTEGVLEPEMLQGLEPGIRGGLWSEKKPQGLEPGILGGGLERRNTSRFRARNTGGVNRRKTSRFGARNSGGEFGARNTLRCGARNMKHL